MKRKSEDDGEGEYFAQNAEQSKEEQEDYGESEQKNVETIPEKFSYKGHRLRLKESIRTDGIATKYEHVVLEFMLFYCIPYKDTKPMAYELLNRFGNLYGVLNAPPELIESVKGITRDAATFLSAMSGICDRYVEESGRRERMSEVDGVLAYMRKVVTPSTESCYVISVNNDDEIVCVEKVLEGTDNALDIPMRLIVKAVLNANARRVIVLHNHPSGKVMPSEEDSANTFMMNGIFDAIKVELVDHLIVYEKYAYSMKNKKVYKHNWRMK